jgi:SAM-dependent methyltransferase
MPKAGEITYLQLAGEASIEHATNKPFSDERCGQFLIALGAIRMRLPPPPARLLDLGCGTGWTSCLFAKMGYDVVGQDIAPDMIHYANVNKQRYQTPNVRFTVCDYEDMQFADEFDGAVFFDCLHHAEDERLALKMVYRALRPGGICVTHEPGGSAIQCHGKGHASAPHHGAGPGDWLSQLRLLSVSGRCDRAVDGLHHRRGLTKDAATEQAVLSLFPRPPQGPDASREVV